MPKVKDPSNAKEAQEELDLLTQEMQGLQGRIQASAARADTKRKSVTRRMSFGLFQTESEKLKARMEVLQTRIGVLNKFLKEFKKMTAAQRKALEEKNRAELTEEVKARVNEVLDLQSVESSDYSTLVTLEARMKKNEECRTKLLELLEIFKQDPNFSMTMIRGTKKITIDPGWVADTYGEAVARFKAYHNPLVIMLFDPKVQNAIEATCHRARSFCINYFGSVENFVRQKGPATREWNAMIAHYDIFSGVTGFLNGMTDLTNQYIMKNPKLADSLVQIVPLNVTRLINAVAAGDINYINHFLVGDLRNLANIERMINEYPTTTKEHNEMSNLLAAVKGYLKDYQQSLTSAKTSNTTQEESKPTTRPRNQSV